MKIEELVDEMTEYLKDGAVLETPAPCTEEDISTAEINFKREFGHSFPDAYKRILRMSNGVIHNGLVIWPVKPQPYFEETIIEANSNFRETFSDEYLYFAQKDEELYVLRIKTNEFCAIEFVGKPVWKRFSNADEMFQFALERAWD